MAFIPLPDGIKIEIKMRKGGAPNVNVVWGTTAVTIDLSVLAAVGAAVRTWWDVNMQPLMSGSIALEEIVVTQWDVADGLQHVESVSPPLAGTATGTDTPSNVAAVTTFYTGYTGRSHRGRVYNPGITDANVTTNTLGTLYVVNMISAWVAFGEALGDLNVQHVVASFQNNNAPRVTGLATPIADYGMNNVVDTQRRRIPQVNN
jgi:hypothetical protein